MASPNLDLVRSIYADWERGDFRNVGWAHPDIEYTAVDGLSPGTSTGIQAMGAGWREFVTDWSDFRAETEEYRELDDERVLTLHRFSGRGRTSGVEVGPTGAKGACLFYVANGKVTKLLLYSVRDRAFADPIAPEVPTPWGRHTSCRDSRARLSPTGRPPCPPG